MNYLDQIDRLISETSEITSGDADDESSPAQAAKCRALLASTENIINAIFSGVSNPYNTHIVSQNEIITKRFYYAYQCALVCTEILKALKIDIESGLVGELENKITAKNFDDFLGHAESYIGEDKKMEAGVIASVVFEDTIKKVATKVGILDVSVIENCISALKVGDHISKAKAASCRAAASVRNSATHADWKDFDISDVKSTIVITRELMEEFLES